MPLVFFGEVLRVLVVASHPDDESLGAGGFIYRLVHDCGAHVTFLILTCGRKGGNGSRRFKKKKRRREAIAAAKRLGVRDVRVLDFPDCGLEKKQHRLIRQVEKQLYYKDRTERYNLVLTHAAGDAHLDHSTVSRAVVSACRRFTGGILFFHTPSTILNEFRPSLFVALDRDSLKAKRRAIKAHVSQRKKDFMSFKRNRKIADGWAAFHQLDGAFEAFEVYRSCWGVDTKGQQVLGGQRSHKSRQEKKR